MVSAKRLSILRWRFAAVRLSRRDRERFTAKTGKSLPSLQFLAESGAANGRFTAVVERGHGPLEWVVYGALSGSYEGANADLPILGRFSVVLLGLPC